jgi:DNA-directed RNA polymerase subunit M/transcription elongation factor TFIIS
MKGRKAKLPKAVGNLKLASEDYLEVVLLKCPQCGAHIIEPAWWADYNSERTCATCGNEFGAKAAEKDRKVVKFFVEKDKIRHVDLKK